MSSPPALELDDFLFGEKNLSRATTSGSSSGCKTKSKRTVKVRRAPTDRQTELMCRGHAFVRKFQKVKSDHVALTNLILSTPPAALSDAFESALGEEHFLTIFDALEHTRANRDDTHETQQATEILSLMLSSARFQFFVEMGSENVQKRVRDRANEILDSPVVAFNTDLASHLETDAIDGRLGTGSACA